MCTFSRISYIDAPVSVTLLIICSPVRLSVEREGGRLAGGADGGGPGAALGAARADLARYVVQGRELVTTRAAAASRKWYF